MDEKKPNREELLDLIESLVEDSPVLAEQSEMRDELLDNFENLEDEELQKLYELLKTEENDWKTHFENTDKSREKIVGEANNGSLNIQKKSERLVRGANEHMDTEADETRAEDLLKNL